MKWKKKMFVNINEVNALVLRKIGMSYRAIGSSVGICRTSPQESLEGFETTGGFQNCSRYGRPKKYESKKCSYAKASS